MSIQFIVTIQTTGRTSAQWFSANNLVEVDDIVRNHVKEFSDKNKSPKISKVTVSFSSFYFSKAVEPLR